MLQIKGQLIKKTDVGFESAIMATCFNQCDYGRRPEMMLVPQDEADIIAIVRYAKTAGLRVSICSGGHSWSQNHLREESLLINMKNFNSYHIDKEQMLATAGPCVGGSVLLGELYKQDLFFPAGHCKGVCIGGYLLQGGFAWNGRKLGLACESVVGLDIITADGDLVHCNTTENADLYWAARGSGGGFFGVVVRFHLRLYPLPKYRRIMAHCFDIQYMDDVFHWAAEVGESVLPAVEFQMITARKTAKFFGTGTEASATIFADSRDELEASVAFMNNSPIRNKAFLKIPMADIGIKMMYNATMTHYPDNYHWGVDNMWTHADINDLLPHLKRAVSELPPNPAHILWLNWQPTAERQNMAFSLEDKIYIALYGCWEDVQDTPLYENWARDNMQRMQHLASGIQLADEGLHRRAAQFVQSENLAQLQTIRAERDKTGLFNQWHKV